MDPVSRPGYQLLSRRSFLKFATVAAAAGLAACNGDRFEDLAGQIPEQPPFSAARLHDLLEELLAAYEARHKGIGASLLPPIDETELRERCDWFPVDLPAEIIALYGWRGGQDLSRLAADDPAFWFRDNIFCSLEDAKSAYSSIGFSYALYPPDRGLLTHAFPFATFEGSFYVLPSRAGDLPPGIGRPVISVFEGVEVYFYSIETMVRSCIDWVRHPEYGTDDGLPWEVEMEIWRRHNPGIFSYS